MRNPQVARQNVNKLQQWSIYDVHWLSYKEIKDILFINYQTECTSQHLILESRGFLTSSKLNCTDIVHKTCRFGTVPISLQLNKVYNQAIQHFIQLQIIFNVTDNELTVVIVVIFANTRQTFL